MYRAGPPNQRPYMGDMGYDHNRGMSFPAHSQWGGADPAYGSYGGSFGGSGGNSFAVGSGGSFGGGFGGPSSGRGTGPSFGSGGRSRGGFQRAPSFGFGEVDDRRHRDSSAGSFRGGRGNKRRGGGPASGIMPQAKKPVFNDPFSALIGYLGHKEKVNVDFTDLPPSAEGSSPMYEARVVLDGTSYTAEGASKKEAKQKMAVVALRDKFGLDASELLQTYLFNLNQSTARRIAMYGEAGAMAQNNATSKADKAESRATIQAAAAALKDSAMDVDPADYTEDFNPFMPTSVVTRKAQYSPAAGKDRILTPIQSSVNGYNNMLPPGGATLSRMGRPSAMGRVAASGRATNGAADTFTSADVKHLLSENQRLKMENEMLRSQLAAGGRSNVHSRLGFSSDDDFELGAASFGSATNPWMSAFQNVVPFANPGVEFERMFKQQPVVESKPGAYEELLEIKRANNDELSVHVKRCETVLIPGTSGDPSDPEKVTFAMLVVKHKITDDGKYRAYRFVGKGSNKTEAIASGSSLAILFVNRLLAGEKLVPLSTSYVSFLIEVMTREGIEKASECIQTVVLTEAKKATEESAVVQAKVELVDGDESGSCAADSQSKEGGGNQNVTLIQTTIRVNDDLEIVQTGSSKSESRENAARKCLQDVYGYDTFTL